MSARKRPVAERSLGFVDMAPPDIEAPSVGGQWRTERRAWIATAIGGFDRAPWEVTASGDEKTCRAAYDDLQLTVGGPVDVRIWDGTRLAGQKTR